MSAHDPFGLSPVSTKLTMLFGGGPAWNEAFFAEFGASVARLRRRFAFAVIAGGPGIWQMNYHRSPWVDTVFQGEAEVDLPRVVASILAGNAPPPFVQGTPPTLEEIPTIIGPARIGEVQVTRGCPRGCEFCSITPEKFRTIPLEAIEREMAVNFAAGESNVEIITDDILLYGAKRLRTNHDAVVELFRRIKAAGAKQIGFAHVSAPAVRESPQTILEIGHIAEWDTRRGLTPVVGLETGSLRIFQKYMPAKAFPFKPSEWKDVILDATMTMNLAGIDPCYTMTIGFPDETDADVDDSIALVDSIIDHGLRAFIFPLPVIPISTSRIGGNPMPQLERLPSRYLGPSPDLLEEGPRPGPRDAAQSRRADDEPVLARVDELPGRTHGPPRRARVRRVPRDPWSFVVPLRPTPDQRRPWRAHVGLLADARGRGAAPRARGYRGRSTGRRARCDVDALGDQRTSAWTSVRAQTFGSLQGSPV